MSPFETTDSSILLLRFVPLCFVVYRRTATVKTILNLGLKHMVRKDSRNWIWLDFIDYTCSLNSSILLGVGFIPMPKDYKRADRLLRSFEKLKEKTGRFIKGTSSHARGDIWTDLWNLFQRDQPKVWTDSRVLNALPNNASIVEQLLQNGGTSQLHLNRSFRDLEWLEEHGQCMDNIRPGISTNKHAGHGAFANRFIPKGGLVAPAPLIHIPLSSILSMYQPILTTFDPDMSMHPDINGPKTYQLILNYCFGHDESTLLLCPYGLYTALINHSSERANARIDWSSEMRHKEWLEQPIPAWGGEHHTGLSFDFVALRDIQEGEEIFIDYGKSWEEAWQDHIRKFVPRKNYVPAFELNKDLESAHFRTYDEGPYERDGVHLYCRYWFFDSAKRHYNGDVRCRILKRLEHDRYMAQLFTLDDDGNTHKIHHAEILWNVPRNAFYFADIPYTRDHHLFTAFRHPMIIPDEMFPDVWRNTRNQ